MKEECTLQFNWDCKVTFVNLKLLWIQKALCTGAGRPLRRRRLRCLHSKPTLPAYRKTPQYTTRGSLIKEKALFLYEKLLRIPMDKFFSTYETRPGHLKMQSGLIQKAIELKKELQIDDKPKSLSLPMNPLADTDVL
ncbi:unnamed protein product, partial [Rodentolepis nana]|uniref:Uncharacterized protein n=1 Tax=Rodentolepis nana TaxID=102285 RepID=A0A0R3TVC1_RODNA